MSSSSQLKFCHSGNIGDIIWSLPTIKAMGGGVLYLKINQPADYANALKHPCGNVMMIKEFANNLIPLLETQSYITKALIWRGEEVDVNLDLFRKVEYDFSKYSMGKYYCRAYAIDPDLGSPWLTAEPDETYCDKWIINRTHRYRNPAINYSFLMERDDIVFVGLSEEYKSFCRLKTNIPHIIAPDFLTLARWIAGCKGFIGNQSFAHSVAEGMKKQPRLLEIFPFAPNSMCTGSGAYDIWTQPIFKEVFNKLTGKTQSYNYQKSKITIL